MRIGIIGCGVAGQAAAIALRRDCHEVTLVERFAKAQALGAGLLLQPSGLAVLERLGLREAAEAVGARVEALDGRTVRGRRVLALDYGTLHGLGIHRGTLFELLHERLKASGAELVLDFAVSSIEDVKTAPTLVSERGEMLGPFDLIVVASGAHDRCREGFSRRLSAPLYPWGCLWCALPDPQGRWSGRLRQRYDGAHTMMGVLPIGTGPGSTAPQVAWFWSLPLAEHEAQTKAGLHSLRQRACKAWPEIEPLLEYLTDFDQLALATYRDVRMRPWHSGRVLAIGDAAHATSPQLGQGANLALIDAISVAAALRQTNDLREALTRYEKMRRAHIVYYQLASRLLTPAFQSHSAVMAWLRDNVLVAARYLPFGGYVTRTTLSGIRKLPWGVWSMPQ